MDNIERQENNDIFDTLVKLMEKIILVSVIRMVLVCFSQGSVGVHRSSSMCNGYCFVFSRVVLYSSRRR